MFRIILVASIIFEAFPVHAFTLATNNAVQRGWIQTKLDISINSTNCPTSVPLNDIIDAAIAPWNTVTASNFILGRGSSSTSTVANVMAGTVADTPVIICDTNFQADSGMSASTVSVFAHVSTIGNSIVHGYVLLNAQVGAAANIANIAPERMSILVAHELGHIIGLGQSTDSNALMYYDLMGRRTTTLGQDDIDGVTYLYERNEPPDGVLGCGLVRGVDTKPPWFTFLLLIPIFLIVLLKRRTQDLPCSI